MRIGSKVKGVGVPTRPADSALNDYAQSTVHRAIYHHARAHLRSTRSVATLKWRRAPSCLNHGRLKDVFIAVRRAARIVILQTSVARVLLLAVEERRQRKAKQAELAWQLLAADAAGCFDQPAPIDEIAASRIAEMLRELLEGFGESESVQYKFLNVAGSFRDSELALRRLQDLFFSNLEKFEEMQTIIGMCADEAYRLIKLFEGNVVDLRTDLREKLKKHEWRDAASENSRQQQAVTQIALEASRPERLESDDCMGSLLQKLEHDLCDSPMRMIQSVASEVHDNLSTCTSAISVGMGLISSPRAHSKLTTFSDAPSDYVREMMQELQPSLQSLATLRSPFSGSVVAQVGEIAKRASAPFQIKVNAPQHNRFSLDKEGALGNGSENLLSGRNGATDNVNLRFSHFGDERNASKGVATSSRRAPAVASPSVGTISRGVADLSSIGSNRLESAPVLSANSQKVSSKLFGRIECDEASISANVSPRIDGLQQDNSECGSASYMRHDPSNRRDIRTDLISAQGILANGSPARDSTTELSVGGLAPSHSVNATYKVGMKDNVHYSSILEESQLSDEDVTLGQESDWGRHDSKQEQQHPALRNRRGERNRLAPPSAAAFVVANHGVGVASEGVHSPSSASSCARVVAALRVAPTLNSDPRSQSSIVDEAEQLISEAVASEGAISGVDQTHQAEIGRRRVRQKGLSVEHDAKNGRTIHEYDCLGEQLNDWQYQLRAETSVLEQEATQAHEKSRQRSAARKLQVEDVRKTPTPPPQSLPHPTRFAPRSPAPQAPQSPKTLPPLSPAALAQHAATPQSISSYAYPKYWEPIRRTVSDARTSERNVLQRVPPVGAYAAASGSGEFTLLSHPVLAPLPQLPERHRRAPGAPLQPYVMTDNRFPRGDNVGLSTSPLAAAGRNILQVSASEPRLRAPPSVVLEEPHRRTMSKGLARGSSSLAAIRPPIGQAPWGESLRMDPDKGLRVDPDNLLALLQLKPLHLQQQRNVRGDIVATRRTRKPPALR